MEEKDKEKGQGGWCPWCMGYGHNGQGPYHHHWHPGFFILRIIIAIVIIAFAFAVGVKLGELRAETYYAGYGGYGYSPMQQMMGGWGGSGYGYGGCSYGQGYCGPAYGAQPMMRYYYNYQAPAAQSAPAAPSTAAPAPTTTGK